MDEMEATIEATRDRLCREVWERLRSFVGQKLWAKTLEELCVEASEALRAAEDGWLGDRPWRFDVELHVDPLGRLSVSAAQRWGDRPGEVRVRRG